MEGFGESLRKARISKKITLRQLSEQVGKSIGYLSDIENERKGPPDLEIVKKIEELLDVKDERLLRLAARLRKKIPKDVAQRIKMTPRLSEALLRADDLSEEEFEELMDFIEKIRKKRA